MTLIVATVTDSGVWMGSERIEGGSGYWTMRSSKIARRGDALIGFAGNARIMQAAEILDSPARGEGALDAWITGWCNHLRSAFAELGLMREPEAGDAPSLAGGSAAIVATEGRVFFLAPDLGWTEPAEGWVSIGSAAEVFAGAYEVLREVHHDPVSAARHAWPYTQRHYHIGDLTDELTLDWPRRAEAAA